MVVDVHNAPLNKHSLTFRNGSKPKVITHPILVFTIKFIVG
jgi:hypothetical protein